MNKIENCGGTISKGQLRILIRGQSSLLGHLSHGGVVRRGSEYFIFYCININAKYTIQVILELLHNSLKHLSV